MANTIDELSSANLYGSLLGTAADTDNAAADAQESETLTGAEISEALLSAKSSAVSELLGGLSGASAGASSGTIFDYFSLDELDTMFSDLSMITSGTYKSLVGSYVSKLQSAEEADAADYTDSGGTGTGETAHAVDTTA